MQSPSRTIESLLSALGTSAVGHAVFSRRGIPLLLLPKDTAIAVATMELYRPQSAKAKIAATAVRMFCRLGLHGTVLPTVPGKSDGTGFLICNPCHGTRVIVVRRGTDGRFEILKAALRENAEPIRREYAVIERLGHKLNHGIHGIHGSRANHERHETISESNHSRMGASMEGRGRAGVPIVGPLEERDGAVWFSMPYLRDAPCYIDPVPLLRSWETGETEPAEENGLIRDLLPLLDEQTRAALAGRTVRRAFVHGDFAPWNWRLAPEGNHETHRSLPCRTCRTGSDGELHVLPVLHGRNCNHEAHEPVVTRLVCIDWEWAREDGFAGFDLVYSLVQQALLVHKVSSNRLMPFINNAIDHMGVESKAYLRNAELSLAVLVNIVLTYRKSKRM